VSGAGPMWGGRFAAAPAAMFCAFNDSLAVDWRLVREDVRASIAWAQELAAVGVLADAEASAIADALADIDAAAATTPDAPVQSKAEDVHTWVEGELVARLGALGKKLHTGRSRNDLVSTDLRLWTRRRVGEHLGELAQLRGELVELAARHARDPMPAYTHLQPAQPVTIGHWALAHEAMLARDAQRLRDALTRVDVCPLGCGALAGTAYPIDRQRLARRLGFAHACENSLDAASDRDFALEVLAVLGACGVHLSRLAEDLIIYNSAEFALVELADEVTSGSSLMPQKKNPDALELIRGRSARIAGAHASLLMVLKAQPLAYNKDNQEDKALLFDASDTLGACLRMAALVVGTTRFDLERCRRRASAGHANATELADYLVAAGAPFREAHEAAGRAVRRAIELGVPLEALPLDELRAIDARVGEDVYHRLTLDATLQRRCAAGGTAPDLVGAAADNARLRLEEERRHDHQDEP